MGIPLYCMKQKQKDGEQGPEKARGIEEPTGEEGMVSLGETRLSEGEGTLDEIGSAGQAVAKPSEVAKRSGTPNSRIVTRSDVSGRMLRASRCAHARRAWARSARESGAGVMVRVAEFRAFPGSAWTSTRWWRSR